MLFAIPNNAIIIVPSASDEEYKEKAFLGALEHIKEYLLGKNPLEIEKHWHHIYRDAYWRGGLQWVQQLDSTGDPRRRDCDSGLHLHGLRQFNQADVAGQSDQNRGICVQ